MCGRVNVISWCGCSGASGGIFGWRHPEQYRDCSDCLTEDMPASLLATILMHILMHRTCIASWKNVEFGRSRARCFFSSIWKLFFLWIIQKLPCSFSKLSYHYLFVIILFRWRAAVILLFENYCCSLYQIGMEILVIYRWWFMTWFTSFSAENNEWISNCHMS